MAFAFVAGGAALGALAGSAGFAGLTVAGGALVGGAVGATVGGTVQRAKALDAAGDAAYATGQKQLENAHKEAGYIREIAGYERKRKLKEALEVGRAAGEKDLEEREKLLEVAEKLEEFRRFEYYDVPRTKGTQIATLNKSGRAIGTGTSARIMEESDILMKLDAAIIRSDAGKLKREAAFIGREADTLRRQQDILKEDARIITRTGEIRAESAISEGELLAGMGVDAMRSASYQKNAAIIGGVGSVLGTLAPTPKWGK